ncbi:hypothetical protein CIC12_12935 [Burkholderia sp. SG-MS1]|uniref:hypothetical protein n=1 Tax=Paraburkholderia sp. SG-MS1 TaxID=2023741 RepID=UPI001446F4E6|nr:hypothetical protein [Paraburkholderia sp. SG-MS1]NKJ47631.1 hypothetical protein [Paraburkholderia sp. SG-MS1]
MSLETQLDLSPDFPVLNRRIRVIGARAQDEQEVRFVSDLVNFPFVVLLGEPGSGKTSTLRAEAARDGSVVYTARELIFKAAKQHTLTVDKTKILYVDGIDEYRSDGNPTDKAWDLTAAMRDLNATRWRIACRSEDWRSEADIKPFLQLSNNEPPLVVQLQPLLGEEVLAILRHLGERSPEQFVETANSFGAHGFLQTPLSVKLLHKAVSRNVGVWPSGRYDLFRAATNASAEEDNVDYEGQSRLSTQQRIALASQACLILLLSGADHIWRSNTSKANAQTEQCLLLDATDLGLENIELSDMLDCSLFKGEGRRFEPQHRTIAEFLAGKALAQTVLGEDNKAAYPLSRAIALISGFDGCPPTELRGLYAWFATHLAGSGDVDGARRLIESDAFSVLAYGDAAALPVELKRAILENLGKNDPYFRASSDWQGTETIALGGLATEELASDFSQILQAGQNEGHVLVTVFEVLSAGRPVTSLRPLLRNIVLDTSRPAWQRIRAVRAWLNRSDISQESEDLLAELKKEPSSIAREKVRVQLALAKAAGPLNPKIVKSILSSFEECSEDNTIGHLTDLQLRMEREPTLGLFDEPFSSWRSQAEARPRSGEVDQILDRVLAAAIRQSTNLDGATIWKWICNVDKNIWSALKQESSKALTDWLAKDEKYGIELFDAILSSNPNPDTPWLSVNIYTHVGRRHPSPALIQELLQKADKASLSSIRRRYLSAAVESSRTHVCESDLSFWSVYEALSKNNEFPELLSRLIQDEWSKDHPRSSVKRTGRSSEDARVAASYVDKFMPVLSEIAAGHQANILGWAAQLYFANHATPEPSSGVNRVAYHTNELVAAAIVTGFRSVAYDNVGKFTATELGMLTAANQFRAIELAAVAGIDILLDAKELSTLDSICVEIAISALRMSHFVQSTEKRQRLERWARFRIFRSTDVGTRALTDFWRTALAAGVTDLALISQLMTDVNEASQVVGSVIEILLVEHKNTHATVLKQLMYAASHLLPTTRILELAKEISNDQSVPRINREMWRYVLFFLKPKEYGEQFVRDNESKDLTALLDSYSASDLASVLPHADVSERIVKENIAIRMFGALVSPTAEFDENSAQGRARQIVHRSMQWLSTTGDNTAGEVLRSLADEPSLEDWRGFIIHALANFNRRKRDIGFLHPAPSSIRSALAGGAPVNSSDLFAVVVEELRRLSSELRSDDVTPWKRYWNVDSNGKPTSPLIENECRDRLLERIRDRLRPYKIVPPMPEARRADETRADIISLTASGHTVPIEAKRNNHEDVWTAAATQLQGYASSVGADGHGVYLVFWFGNSPNKTTSRPDGSDGPMTATEMEKMLKADLPADISIKTEVIVFDVSDPRSKGAKPRKPRKPKAA